MMLIPSLDIIILARERPTNENCGRRNLIVKAQLDFVALVGQKGWAAILLCSESERNISLWQWSKYLRSERSIGALLTWLT